MTKTYSTNEVLAILIALAVTGCGGNSEPAAADVPFRRLSYLGWLPSGNYVFRTSNEFAATLNAAWIATPTNLKGFNGSPVDEPAPVEVIDFTTTTVIAVSLDRGNRCQNVVVTNVQKNKNEIVVQYRIQPPGNPTLVCFTMDFPWNTLVAVPNIGSATVEFRRTDA